MNQEDYKLMVPDDFVNTEAILTEKRNAQKLDSSQESKNTIVQAVLSLDQHHSQEQKPQH